jgi:Transposase DDE domain
MLEPPTVQSALFLDVLKRMINGEEVGRLCEEHAPVPQTEPKLKAPELVSSVIFHQLQEGGTQSRSTDKLYGVKMSDSAHTQRRERLPVELFEEIAANALRPLADPERDQDCFFEGLRLLIADGSQFSAQNTPVLKKQLPKMRSRRLEAAFGKIRMVVVIEMGTHAPIAVAAAPASEGEQTLAKRVWGMLPNDSLLSMDRLFGTACTLNEAMTATEGRNVHFLVRVRDNIKITLIEHLSDGSSLVDVPMKEGNKIIKQLRLREINAVGVGRDGKQFKLRLWTTLLDRKRFPADRLAREYAERWEVEIYYKELKVDVRGTSVLASHTLETALQEVLALTLASAVLAHLRVEAAERLEIPTRRVSFFKLLLATRELWAAYRMAGTVLPASVKAHIWKQYVADVLSTAILPERRARTCPRVLRQPVSKWARKIDQPSYNGEVTLEVVRG